MANPDMNIIVRAKNEASKVLKEVQKDVSGLDKTAGMLKGGLAGIAGAIGIGALQQVTQEIGAMVEQASRVQLLRASFDQLADSVGQSADSMLSTLRAASYGMVADADLMLSANKAMLLGVADTADEMAALLEVARARGQAMGLDVTQAFNDIVTGLGRESALILDNLGIVVDLEKTMSDYAATLNTTVDALSGVERKQALVNAVMAQSANMQVAAPSGVSAQLAQLKVAQEQAKQEIGAFFAPNWRDNAQAQIDLLQQLQGKYSEYAATVREVSDVVADGRFGLLTPLDNQQIERFTALRDAMNMLADDNEVAIVGMTGLRIQLDAIADSAMRNQQVTAGQAAAIEKAAASATAARAAYAAESAELDKLDPKLDNVRESTAGMASGMETAGRSVDAIKAKLAALAGQADVTGAALKSAWISAAGALGAGQALAGWKAQSKELELLRQGMNYAGIEGEERAFKEAEYSQRAIDGIHEQIQAIEEATRATTAQGAAVAGVSSAYSDLEGKVSGVLSQSLGDLGGFDPSSVLPREDAIAENARRLAAIANEGLANQPWLEEFKREVPEVFAEIANSPDPKAAAARIAQEFQDGLRPELLDKDKAKERVKRMILGEQNMAALAAEIAQELAAEMGIPLEEALAATGAALGVPAEGEGEAGKETTTGAPDMSGQGAAAGSTFVAGFQTTATGTFLVASIVQQMEGAIVTFNNTGQNAGKQWGAGFMTTVETSIAQPLINLLVALVTPGVMAQLAAADTQTTPP